MGRVNWHEFAACRGADPDLFFPPVVEENRGASRVAKAAEENRIATAKSYCAICPTSRICLDQALERGEKVGIWGGVDLEAPRKLQDRQRAARKRGRKKERSDAAIRRVATEADVHEIAKWRRRAIDALDKREKKA